jgi:conjugal transfer/type IV secretion protein DotA/TraY
MLRNSAQDPYSQKSLASFVLLPGIIPRIQALFSGGFGMLAYFILVVFNTVRIIPDTSPYLKPETARKISVVKALTITANHIRFDFKNIDKVMLFFAVIAGIFLMLFQLVLCVLAIFTLPAFAYGGPTGSFASFTFFQNPNTNEDIAFRLLDLVFGLPNIFASKDMATTPFHEGLHALLAFYSYGIMLVGVFVIIYLTITVVMETAHHGIPFGKRFNRAWAPIRLVLFFGLLLPTANGLNLAQYIVFEAAKLGSNVATNGWILFDTTVSNAPYLGTPAQLIINPNAPSLNVFVSFMQLARTCSFAEGRTNGRDIKPYAVFGSGTANAVEIGPTAPSLTDFTTRSNGGSIKIRFGEQNATRHVNQEGAVFPYCGELRLDIVDRGQPGAVMMQQAYLELISCLWQHNNPSYSSSASNALGANPRCLNRYARERAQVYGAAFSNVAPRTPFVDLSPYENPIVRAMEVSEANTDITNAINRARQEQIANGDWANSPAMQMGWGGAGIWFNRIAEQNGAFMSAIHAIPQISKMPFVMEFVREKKLESGARVSGMNLYSPVLPDGTLIHFDEPADRDVALMLNQLYMFWGSEESMAFFAATPDGRSGRMTGNVMIDAMNAFLGTNGIFNMCRNTDIHPLAQLSGVGRGLIEHSIRGFGGALGFGILGFSLSALLERQNLGGAFEAASKSLMTFATIGLVLGFVLFYVVPFLPFVYFFFAVTTWIKGIFEAVVAMPLWALAHLRIDGQGMPGPAASSGYFYILEIFLRPICILLGFLIGIAVFTAMVKVLNQIFYLVISNYTGQIASGATGCFIPPGMPTGTPAPEPNQFIGGVIDEFFYTVLYAIVVYMIAMPCFKMVDAVPDNIMRWMGTQVSSFGSQDGDPAGNLMSYVSAGVVTAGKGFSGAGQAFLLFR